MYQLINTQVKGFFVLEKYLILWVNLELSAQTIQSIDFFLQNHNAVWGTRKDSKTGRNPD